MTTHALTSMENPGLDAEMIPSREPADEHSGMVWIPAGTFRMGSNLHYPEEAPEHRVTVDGFWMDTSPVTNRMFRMFVEQTGYATLCEKAPNADDYPDADASLLVPSSAVFVAPGGRVGTHDHYQWWLFVPGANWRHPQGPDSTLAGKEDHPVVHIAYEDVQAYAQWAGKMLPTEAEWEWAARGAGEDTEYAWGNELAPEGRHLANTWQGEFPWQNLADDGYEGTSPVGAFPPNPYGLHDMIGNVWEWTADWFTQRHSEPAAKACCIPSNPRGGSLEGSFDPAQPQIRIPRKVMKGGSHLCAPNYCQRYRPAARMSQPVDTSTSHLGFRCVVHSPAPWE